MSTRWSVSFVPLLLLATLTGCGKGAETGSSNGTSLTITVTATPGADPKTYELECDPAGGDHPQAAQACAALDRAGAQVFEPVAADQVCTMQIGGPQTATVEGTYLGEPVDATFSLNNGCEISRWDKLGTTFFDLPRQ